MDAVIERVPPQGDALAEPEDTGAGIISLVDFITEFGAGLLSQVWSQNPPVYDGRRNARWNAVLGNLKRRPFPAQLDAVHAATHLLEKDAPAAILNAEMGTGKTMMAICVAAIAQSRGLRRSLIISPPQLVYKWWREIKETVPGARVWILNGPDTSRKLLALRAAIGAPASDQPEFFILGRVRMRMGFHWRPSAQGQAMGVLGRKCRKTLLLTGTLMGGYADDLFHLLWRLHPGAMIEDGFKPGQRGSMAGATMSFMREHGVLKDIYKETSKTSHRTAKGDHISHRVSKAPGFGPKGILRYVLPSTVFLKLKDIGQDVLPPYEEIFTGIQMTEPQREAYVKLSSAIVAELKAALRVGDSSLLGVVLNVLLAWPDCAFRDECVCHPRTHRQLAFQSAIFNDVERSPKEEALLQLCADQKARGRRVLAYSVYTGKRDTTERLKAMLVEYGFKAAVLRASVDASRREDWVAEQVDRGIDVMLCNPELVKTGLDLLDFPTIAFMQSGYNVYTVQQAARRSWRIGQRHPVEVHYLGYEGTAQMECLRLMAKIAVSQSTSGDMPDCGLDILNDAGDSIEVAQAKQLIS